MEGTFQDHLTPLQVLQQEAGDSFYHCWIFHLLNLIIQENKYIYNRE